MSDIEENTNPETPIPPDAATPGWVRGIQGSLTTLTNGVNESNSKLDGLASNVATLDERLRKVELRSSVLPIAMSGAAMLLSFAAFALAIAISIRGG